MSDAAFLITLGKCESNDTRPRMLVIQNILRENEVAI